MAVTQNELITALHTLLSTNPVRLAMRSGLASELDLADLLVGEIAVATDTLQVWVCTALGTCIQITGGLTALGYYATAGDLSTAHPTGTAGDIYIVGSAPSHLYTWGESAWVDLGAYNDTSTFAANESVLHITGDETITGYKSVLSPTSADHIANKAYVDRYSPVGEIKIWPTASAPVGFLLCNGTLISRTTYAGLFAVIGTSYGAGNGSTTFALPNLLGKVVVGKTASGTFSTLGAAVGSETVSLTESQNGPHFHGFSNNFIDGAQMNGTPNRQVACAGGGSIPGGAVTSTAGAGSAHNNIQPTVVMNYIIRALA